MITSSNSLCREQDAQPSARCLLHTMSGIELSRVRTELQLLSPEGYQQKSDRVERGRHCYAIMWFWYDSTCLVCGAISTGRCNSSNSRLGFNRYARFELPLQIEGLAGNAVKI